MAEGGSPCPSGTSFTIYWPRGLGEADPERLAILAAAGRGTNTPLPIVTTTGRGTETILLAEHEPQVRLVAAGILRRAGYTLLVAEDAPDALRIAQHHGAGIDLLISDAVMPQASGLQLATQIRALRPAIALLHMSGHMDDTTRHGVHDSEGVFLQKPLTPELLRRKVREALTARSGISR